MSDLPHSGKVPIGISTLYPGLYCTIIYGFPGFYVLGLSPVLEIAGAGEI